jgi:hypothetical protein
MTGMAIATLQLQNYRLSSRGLTKEADEKATQYRNVSAASFVSFVLVLPVQRQITIH